MFKLRHSRKTCHAVIWR